MHARELVRDQCYPDPGVRRGPLRVLPRTDLHYIVVDERRPMGDQVVFIGQARGLTPRALEEARFALELLAERDGIPPDAAGEP